MLPHRSDTSRGHLHPPTRPRLSLPPFRRSPSFFLLDVRLELTSRTTAEPGWFLPCDRLCRHFPGGACASSLSLPSLPSPRFFATTRTPSLPPLPVVSLQDATAIVYASNLFTPGATTFHPEIVARNGRLHDFWNFRSYDREQHSTMAMCSRRLLRSLGAREQRLREICPLAS